MGMEPEGLRMVRKEEDVLDAIAQAAREADQPIRVRIQPNLFHPGRQRYYGWQGVSQLITVGGADDVRAFWEALLSFFELTERLGARETEAYMREVHAAIDQKVLEIERERVAAQEPAAPSEPPATKGDAD